MRNHDIISSEALFFKAVDKDVEDEILDLFENSNGPEKARRMYIASLKAKYGDLKFLEKAADRSVNPDKPFYYNLYRKYWLKKLGTVNGPDATQKAIEMINEYNENTGEKIASFKINEKNQTIVAVLEELSERVHQMVPHAGDRVNIYHLYLVNCASLPS